MSDTTTVAPAAAKRSQTAFRSRTPLRSRRRPCLRARTSHPPRRRPTTPTTIASYRRHFIGLVDKQSGQAAMNEGVRMATFPRRPGGQCERRCLRPAQLTYRESPRRRPRRQARIRAALDDERLSTSASSMTTGDIRSRRRASCTRCAPPPPDARCVSHLAMPNDLPSGTSAGTGGTPSPGSASSFARPLLLPLGGRDGRPEQFVRVYAVPGQIGLEPQDGEQLVDRVEHAPDGGLV